MNRRVRNRPVLRHSPLTHSVYVVTDYTLRDDGTLLANRKHDVTEDFNALANDRAACKAIKFALAKKQKEAR
jgi:hypothetical protein